MEEKLNNSMTLSAKPPTCRNVCAHSLDRTLTTALWPRPNRPTTQAILRHEMLVQFLERKGTTWGRGSLTIVSPGETRVRGSPRSCRCNSLHFWRLVCGDEEEEEEEEGRCCSSRNPTTLACPAEWRSDTNKEMIVQLGHNSTKMRLLSDLSPAGKILIVQKFSTKLCF